MNLADEKVWKQLLEKDPRLKDLAIKAGVENNSQRAEELNGCIAINGGRDVIKSKEEEELAFYLFSVDYEDPLLKTSIEGRIAAARAAGIDINDI